jgi:hypothetical protein
MFISAPFVMVGYAMFLGSTEPKIRYAATFLIAIGAFSFVSSCSHWAESWCLPPASES